MPNANLRFGSCRERYLVAVLAVLTATVATQGQGGPPTNPFPTNDNQWHLGYSVQSYASTGTFADVASHQMGDQSASHPMEVSDIWAGPSDKKTVLLTPPTDCVNTGPASTNACTFISTSATQVDESHFRYTFRNWGGRCVISLRVMEYDQTLSWEWSDPTPWSSGSPFIVVVPEKAVPNTAEVFGKLAGANIFFTPSDPLSDTDAKYFKLVEPKKIVPGLGTVYRFQTK
jgi:hypothetical protein